MERLVAANARVQSTTTEAKRERADKERERNAAEYFARYDLAQNAKLEVMHERLHRNHDRSIENPEAGCNRL